MATHFAIHQVREQAMPHKKPTTMITIQQRQQIVAKAVAEPTWSQSDLARWATVHFKRTKNPISKATVNRALKLAEATASVTGIHALRTKMTPAAFPRLEEELVRWVDRANGREISVSQLMIREQAREIANNLEIPVGDFKFSNVWLWAFKKRYNIQVLQDHGEAGSCNPNDVSRGRLECQDIIMQFNRPDVYNLDETALNYCSHSRRSHQRPGTKKGRKLSKQRITVMLATNADGADKLPPYFVRLAKKPQCFKGKRASHYNLDYDANAKGWMRSDLFGAWLARLEDQFWQQNRHALLLMGNVSSHKTEGLILTNIKVYKLAPNTTPFNQHLDAGTIRAFKAGFAQRRDRNAAKYANSTEKNPYKVDVLSAMQWAVEAWDELKLSTVSNCWNHTKVLPAPSLYEVAERDLEYTSGPVAEQVESPLCAFMGSARFCDPMSMEFLLS